MKFLVVFVLVAFVAVTFAADAISLNEEQKAKVRATAGECIEKEKTTKEEVQKLRQGQFGAADENLKCFANCFLEKLGFFVNGAIKEDVVSGKLSPIVGADRVKEVMAKCNSIKGANNCETAYKLYECYYTNNAALV
ncbi:general odorant-binding protein 56d-like [Teleopsis dalmanni]|uniref:general odorant-binding protein 56d-like n=1 Tax=Teleopsis dalmanni TaxID=139649 RepID=UPI0018CD81F4|nr:general odorant-binding protein 56d-like [Teleopsis dalmanni]